MNDAVADRLGHVYSIMSTVNSRTVKYKLHALITQHEGIVGKMYSCGKCPNWIYLFPWSVENVKIT